MLQFEGIQPMIGQLQGRSIMAEGQSIGKLLAHSRGEAERAQMCSFIKCTLRSYSMFLFGHLSFSSLL